MVAHSEKTLQKYRIEHYLSDDDQVDLMVRGLIKLDNEIIDTTGEIDKGRWGNFWTWLCYAVLDASDWFYQIKQKAKSWLLAFKH